MSLMAGDLIFAGDPFAACVLAEYRHSRCDHCLRILAVFYCSRLCLKSGADCHRWECRLLSERPIATFPRLMARIIAKITSCPEHMEEVCGRQRKWDHLMDHYEDVIHDSASMLAFNHIFHDLELIFQKDLDVVRMIGIYGKILVNSFAIQDEYLRPIGRAVYLGASVFDHSCHPNASFMFVGTRICIKALKDIDGDPIQNVRICYLDELDTSEERGRQLLSHFYFSCDCVRCTKPNISCKDLNGSKEGKDLLSIREALESLDLNTTSIVLQRKQMLTSNVSLLSKPSVQQQQVLGRLLDSPDKLAQAEKLINQMRSMRPAICGLDNVIAVRIADVLSAIDQDLELSLRVLNFMTFYYGPKHPRTALQNFLVANMVADDMNLKQRLLLSAHHIASLVLPSVREAAGSKSTTPSFVTLLTVNEEELKRAQEEVRCRTSVARIKTKAYGADVSSQASQSSAAAAFARSLTAMRRGSTSAFAAQTHNTWATSQRSALSPARRQMVMPPKQSRTKSSISQQSCSRSDVVSLRKFVDVY